MHDFSLSLLSFTLFLTILFRSLFCITYFALPSGTKVLFHTRTQIFCSSVTDIIHKIIIVSTYLLVFFQVINHLTMDIYIYMCMCFCARIVHSFVILSAMSMTVIWFLLILCNKGVSKGTSWLSQRLSYRHSRDLSSHSKSIVFVPFFLSILLENILKEFFFINFLSFFYSLVQIV